MHNPATLPPPLPMRAPIAHWTHTLAVLLVLTGIAVSGHLRAVSPVVPSTPGASGYGGASRYLSSVIYEWLLLGSVIAGIYNRRAFFSSALFQQATSLARSFGFGLLAYVLGLAAILCVAVPLHFTRVGAMHNRAIVHAMMPQTSSELLLWLLVSFTAGICEEFIFRGYLLQQLTAWTQRPVLAIVVGGLLFGAIHLYEGLAAILPIAALGILYGFFVRRLRGDLRAVIIAHTLQDSIVALFGFLHGNASSNQLQAVVAKISFLPSFFS